MATNFYKQGGSYYTTAGQKILNPTELQSYAKAGGKEIQAPQIPAGIPTGATKIAGPSGLQGLNESQIYRSGTDIYKLPPIPTQVSGDQLTGGVPNVPVVEQAPIDTTPFVAGLDTGQKGFESLIKPIMTPTATEAKVTPITQKITELTGGFEQKPADYQAQLDQYGFKTNVQDLQNLNTQIAATKAQYDKLTQAEEGRKGLAGSIYGRQALAQRQAAIELGGLSSMAQALQGNVQMAMDIADKTIAIKYEPLERQIEDQKFQLEQVYDQLGREEKRKADALNIALDERQRKIEEEKEKETNISNVMLAAAQAGADSGTLQQIMKSTDYMSAIQLASKYLDQTETTWEESEVLDANGNPMLFNPSTGEYKTAVGTSTSDIYFTDANGDSWNIAGWATDQTKPQQMNAIAKRIGKLTDENLVEKVKEFTPAITPEMIKEASAQSGVSWEAIMTMVVQEAQGGLSNVAKNNNNFGGLTFNNQEWIKPFGGVKGTDRPEGGNYIKFPTKQAGLNAMANLMAQYGKVEPVEPVKNSAQNWADLINKGEAKITDVPADERTEVANALALTPKPQDQELDLIAKEKAKIASTLKSHSGLSNAVGTIALGRKAPFQWGQKEDFIASVEQLVSDLSLESLIDAKSRGATFGALSDSEMRILASAATKIGTWRLRDENGNVTGYKASESAFKKELDNISKIFLRAVKGAVKVNELNQSTNTIQTSTPIMIGQTPDGMGYQVIE